MEVMQLILYPGMAQFGRALVLGTRGRGFESLCPDHYAGVAQLVEQLPCKHQVGGSSPSTSSI